MMKERKYKKNVHSENFIKSTNSSVMRRHVILFFDALRRIIRPMYDKNAQNKRNILYITFFHYFSFCFCAIDEQLLF